jgi:hypothetical protein
METGQGFSFYRIHILQSLQPGDWNTGLHLLRFIEDLPDAYGHVRYKPVETAVDLFNALLEIRDELITTGQIPLIHIEAHGDIKGLRLTSGDVVEWKDLKEVLTEINIACQANLLVAVAACLGENLVSMARLHEPAPFWGCIGPRGEEQSGTLHDNFKRFYSKLLEEGNLRAALEAADGGLPTEGKPLVFWPAEFFFAAVFRAYVKEFGGEYLRDRAELIAREIKFTSEVDIEISEEAKVAMAAALGSYEPIFEECRRIFLMLDRFPEIEKRFVVKFSHVQGGISA